MAVSSSASHGNSSQFEGGVSEVTGAFRMEETSLDMLKNTPSNIARLEDKIEQCKGRQKYLAQTRSRSDGGDVRWYFCKVPLAENEMAASVPRTEIVGKSEYFRFGMRDSLAIEASFLEREEELLSSWWKEYAECSEGPRARPSTSNKSDTVTDASSIEHAEEERVGVPVKGGLYEVDLVKRDCFPVYWNGENRRVLRGHWFARKGGLDWFPLREDVAEQLEIAYRSQVWHRRTFQPSGLFAARVDLQGSTLGLHAFFTGEDDTWEAWLNVDASGCSSIIPLGGNGIKLRRGYSPSHSPKPTQDELRQQKEEEMDDYCSQVPVRHLVFMVHGIGQRLEKSNLVDDVGNFRHITASLAERHLTSHQRGSQRVLFIPCQWRKGLKLSGEAAVDKITLDGVRGLRVMLGATVHDVLFYMSPIYCQNIIDSVSNQLNRLYLKFLKRNAGYNGKVSIYGHSLGSVISYDILCHQENLSSPFPMEWMYEEHATREKSSPDTNNQSAVINSLTNNMGHKNSLVGQETENSAGPIDDDERNSQEPFLVCEGDALDGKAEDASTIVGPDSSDLDEVVSARTIISKQPSFEEDASGSVYNYKDTVLGENDISLVTTGRNDQASDDIGGIAQEASKDASDKDRVIKLLTAEINSLKAKITDVESKCSSGDGSPSLQQENKELRAIKLEQPLSEKIRTGQDALKSYTPYIKYTKLEFKVDTFFAVGSPLGVFLALRNVRMGIGKGQDYWEEGTIHEEMPACRKMFNIFHPFDPVAYRIEPLVCKEYVSKRPVIIPYHKGGKRLHIGFQEFSKDLAARSQAIVDHLHSVRVKVLTVCQSKKFESLEEGAETAQEEEEKSYGSLMMERLTGSKEGRIDHVLQDKTFQHAYISAIGAHTNYWRDYDTALFILQHLYRDIPEEPNSQEESSGDDLKNKGGSIGWSDKREIIDEELPLTFSDQRIVRNFSSKARKHHKQGLRL